MEFAEFLHEGLKAAGHEVFIDRVMTVGTDWVKEIDSHIASCDVMVVLLSESSMNSQMVQGEVRKAAKRLAKESSFRIFPIRLRYFGPLEYELDSLLSRIQYARWETPNDSPGVLAQLLDALGGGQLPHAEQRIRAASARRRPGQTAVEDRSSIALGSRCRQSARRSSPSLPRGRRPGDQARGEERSDSRHHGPAQMGKSSLLLRYLWACDQAGKAIAYVDFDTLESQELDDYRTLLTIVLKSTLSALGLPHDDVGMVPSQSEMTPRFEDRVVKVVTRPLVLAFDQVDHIAERPYSTDFYAMLRSWHNRRNFQFPWWRTVDLVLVISTEPAALIRKGTQSAFSVAEKVRPEAFSRAECLTLNELSGINLRGPEIDRLYTLLHGHPYLTRLAFYHLGGGSPTPMTLSALESSATDAGGPFSEHLRALFYKLSSRPELVGVLKLVIKHATEPSQDDFLWLWSAGLVRRENGKCLVMNKLYADYFGSLL